MSPDAVASSVCLQEVEYAAAQGKRFMPVVYRHVDNADVPEALVSINYVFFTGNDATGAAVDFDTARDQLITALLTDIAWVREHTRLGKLARQWDSSNRPSDQLLRGRELQTAIDWLHETIARDDSKELDNKHLTHTFIQSSAHAIRRHGHS